MFSQHSPHPKTARIKKKISQHPWVFPCLKSNNVSPVLPSNTQHLLSIGQCFSLCLLSIALHPLAIFNTPIISWHFPNILSMPHFFLTPLNVFSMVTYCQKNDPLMFSWHCSNIPSISSTLPDILVLSSASPHHQNFYFFSPSLAILSSSFELNKILEPLLKWQNHTKDIP